MFGSKFAMLSLLLVLVGAGVFPFIDFGQGPMLQFSEIKGPKLPDIDLQSHINQADQMLDNFSSETKPNHQQVVRWQDENGQWHYSDARPDTASSTETMSINLKQNVVAAFKAPPEPEPEIAETTQEDAEGQQASAEETELPSSPLEMLPTPDNVKNLVNSANNIQPMLDQRKRQQDAIVNGRF